MTHSSVSPTIEAIPRSQGASNTGTPAPDQEARRLRTQRIEVLGQLAGGVVHDINNILTAIMGSASLLEMGDVARTPIHIGNIMKSSQRGAHLLRQLQQFSPNTDGEMAPTDIAGVLTEAAGTLSESFGANYQVGVAATDDLPPIHADASQIHQIIVTLCANSRDAMPGGGSITIMARRVCISSEQAVQFGQGARAGEFIEVSVRDSGTGISPDIQSRLFDPFFTTKPKGKGFGLGLALVHRLITRHKGFIRLESEVGQGSCFACHFPVTTQPTLD